MKKVSIIIPVYNSEKYLRKCLESVVNQTVQDFEVIVVNDGSKDKSQEIINEYKQKYPNTIIAIEQENKGVARTRNDSIKRANGKYIMFIDNDDFIDNNYIEIFVNEAEKNDYDIVLGGYRRPDEKGKILRTQKLKDYEWSKFMIMAPWAKIYKKQYLMENNIEFLENNLGEDVYFNLKAMLLSDNLKIIDYVGYNWFFNGKSVSNTKQKSIKNLQVYNLLDSCYNMLKEFKLLDENYEIIKLYFVRYAVWLLTFSTKGMSNNSIKEENNKIFNWLNNKFTNIKKLDYSLLKGEDIKIKLILKVFMIFYKIHLEKIVLYIYSKI